MYGKDWEVVRATGDGFSLEDGITQTSERSLGSRSIYVWNFPLEITFKSTNPFGWPALVLVVSENRGRGYYPIKGYGWCHIPVFPGRYKNIVRLFKPRASSTMQYLWTKITGRREPEFIHPEFITKGKGRELTRVQSEGCVSVSFDIMIKDLKSFGFDQPKKMNYTQVDLSKEVSLMSDLNDSPLSKKIS